MKNSINENINIPKNENEQKHVRNASNLSLNHAIPVEDVGILNPNVCELAKISAQNSQIHSFSKQNSLNQKENNTYHSSNPKSYEKNIRNTKPPQKARNSIPFHLNKSKSPIPDHSLYQNSNYFPSLLKF
jgi:hypothetical protein